MKNYIVNIIVEQNTEQLTRRDIAAAFLVETAKRNFERIEIVPNVELKDKKLLSVGEAADLFGIGRNKIRELSSDFDCPFVIWIGGHRRIKREAFEEFIMRQYSI